MQLILFAGILLLAAASPVTLDNSLEAFGLGVRDDQSKSCRVLCDPDGCQGQNGHCSGKRDLTDVSFDNSTWSYSDEYYRRRYRRKLADVKERNIEAYLDKYNVKNKDITGIIDDGTPGRDRCYCIQVKFDSLARDRAHYWGTHDSELTGCTMLTVVSARAMYMCHFWETASFIQSEKPNRPPPDFQRTVVNLILGKRLAVDYATGVKFDNSLFNAKDDNTVAFISTPRKYDEQGPHRTPLYKDRIDSLTKLMEGLIGKNGRVIVRPYEKPGPSVTGSGFSYPEEQTWRGQLLLEYDPNGIKQNQADWRLWMEDVPKKGSECNQKPI